MSCRLNVLALVLILGLAACSLSQRVPPVPTPVQGWPSEADAAVRAAVQDWAAKLKVKSDAINVVSVTATDWSDTSLGCPQPGMFYAQVIVQGYTLVLASGGEQVEYHADRKGRVVTCGK